MAPTDVADDLKNINLNTTIPHLQDKPATGITHIYISKHYALQGDATVVMQSCMQHDEGAHRNGAYTTDTRGLAHLNIYF